MKRPGAVSSEGSSEATSEARPADFEADVRRALGDGQLRGALRHATELFAERRGRAVDEVPEWQELRARARAVKAATLARHDHWLELFERRAQEAGTQVHWARDDEQANRIIAGLVAASGARTIVKSKSMTTEETGLNRALEQAGLRVVETDLGEYIIQLAGETPSHIIVPAIHKTREEIGALFAQVLGAERGSDPLELTRVARERLRDEFARADVGLSGANFAVAETGSFLVLENEGNARMCTSLPRVHIALIGIEKLVPRLEDLDLFLRLLPRSGTGQQLTSYQTLFTGPRAEGREGPEELHVVLLDNGRSALLADPLTRDVLGCIRCGACLNVCPVYGEIGGHAYGSVYPGPIGAVITPLLGGLESAPRLPFASSLCGACREVCPLEIDLPGLLLELRARSVEPGGDTKHAQKREEREEREEQPLRKGSGGGAGWSWSFRVWAFAMAGPRRYALFARLLRWARPILARPALSKILARGIPALAAWRAQRELPLPARRSFRQEWRARADSLGEAREGGSHERTS